MDHIMDKIRSKPLQFLEIGLKLGLQFPESDTTNTDRDCVHLPGEAFFIDRYLLPITGMLFRRRIGFLTYIQPLSMNKM